MKKISAFSFYNFASHNISFFSFIQMNLETNICANSIHGTIS